MIHWIEVNESTEDGRTTVLFKSGEYLIWRNEDAKDDAIRYGWEKCCEYTTSSYLIDHPAHSVEAAEKACEDRDAEICAAKTRKKLLRKYRADWSIWGLLCARFVR